MCTTEKRAAMKRSLMIICTGLLCMPGCFRKSVKRPSIDAPREKVPSDAITESPSMIYDEQEHAFILEDRGNPFEQMPGQSDNQPLWVEDEEPTDLETIYFGFDQYDIASGQMKSLKRTASALKKLLKDKSGVIVVIHGHACNSAGSWKYNMLLSETRAKEVKKALIKLGIPENRLKVVGHGFEMPKVASGTREQQAPNRRVEFTFVHTKKSLAG
jgi:outer membrane protein OmpA-like peptidoglycan-associated protein